MQEINQSQNFNSTNINTDNNPEPQQTSRKKPSISPPQNSRYSLFKTNKPHKIYEYCEVPSSSRRQPPNYLQNKLRKRMMRPKFMSGKNKKKRTSKKTKSLIKTVQDKRRTKSGEFVSTNIISNPKLSHENGFYQQLSRGTKNLSSISNFDEAEPSEEDSSEHEEVQKIFFNEKRESKYKIQNQASSGNIMDISKFNSYDISGINNLRRSSKKTNFSSSFYFSNFKPVLSFLESKNDIHMEEPMESAHSKKSLINKESLEMKRKLKHEFYSQNFNPSSKIQRTSIITLSINERRESRLLEQAKKILRKNNESRRISRMRVKYRKEGSLVHHTSNLRMDSSVTHSNVMGILKPCSFSSDKKLVSRHKSMKGSKNSSQKKVSFNRHRIVYKYSVNSDLNGKRNTRNNKFYYDNSAVGEKSKFGRQNSMNR